MDKILKFFYFNRKKLWKDKTHFPDLFARFFSLLFFKSENTFAHNSTQSSQNFLTEKTNISYLNQPGIYEIFDVENNKSYYGETNYLIGRLEVHTRSLRTGTHPCKRLQESYNKIREIEKFQFFIVVAGSEWVDKKKRVEFQNKLIEDNKDRCYNQTFEEMKSPPVSKIRRISYKGHEYANIRAAVKQLE